MTWQEARDAFPDRWLLAEAQKARTENGQRILEDIAILKTHDSSQQAFREYEQLHREQPFRELIVVHTSRPTLDVLVRYRFGVRPLPNRDKT